MAILIYHIPSSHQRNFCETCKWLFYSYNPQESGCNVQTLASLPCPRAQS